VKLCSSVRPFVRNLMTFRCDRSLICIVYVGFSIPGTPDYGIITPRDNFPGKIGLVDRLTVSKRI
jgi:hypothetical protein